MKIKKIEPGSYCSNTYIIYDEKSNEGAIIDPGGMAEKLIFESRGINVKYIILTHAHFDHIGALEDVAEKTGASVIIHELEAHALTDVRYNLSTLAGVPENKRGADKTVKDGEMIKLGETELKFIHTPGHTPGCMCIFVGDKDLITGDTLFCGSIGRTDFEGGSFEQMSKSLERLATFNDEITIYPGHGEESTIGFEKRSNPYMV